MQWTQWITWAALLFNYLVIGSILVRQRQTRRKNDRTFGLLHDRLGQQLAVMMALDQCPARPSEASPGHWSLDIEPEMLAYIQQVAAFGRAQGMAVVAGTRKTA